MKIDIENYENYAVLGAFGPLIAIAFIAFVILISPFALLGYIISKICKIHV